MFYKFWRRSSYTPRLWLQINQIITESLLHLMIWQCIQSLKMKPIRIFKCWIAHIFKENCSEEFFHIKLMLLFIYNCQFLDVKAFKYKIGSLSSWVRLTCKIFEKTVLDSSSALHEMLKRRKRILYTSTLISKRD